MTLGHCFPILSAHYSKGRASITLPEMGIGQGSETSGRNRFLPGRMEETGKKVPEESRKNGRKRKKLKEMLVVKLTCQQSVGKKFPDTLK